MSIKHEITEAEIKEIEKVLKQNKDKNVDRRLRALLLYATGKKHKEISIETGYASTYITELARKYKNFGLIHIAGNNYVGNHRLLSFEEEAEFLSQFIERAEAGQILEIREIQLAYEELIGRPLNSKGHMYQLLKRHGFRKISPRSSM